MNDDLREDYLKKCMFGLFLLFENDLLEFQWMFSCSGDHEISFSTLQSCNTFPKLMISDKWYHQSAVWT